MSPQFSIALNFLIMLFARLGFLVVMLSGAKDKTRRKSFSSFTVHIKTNCFSLIFYQIIGITVNRNEIISTKLSIRRA